MLEQEFQYYLTHQADLVKQHYGRYIIIKDQKVMGDFGSEVEAILYARDKLHLTLGTFLVQQCMPGKENFTQFFSNVIFT